MENDNLKPCPLCGGDGELYLSHELLSHIQRATKAWYQAYCKTCSAAAQTEEDREKAIENWNKRFSPTIGLGTI